MLQSSPLQNLFIHMDHLYGSGELAVLQVLVQVYLLLSLSQRPHHVMYTCTEDPNSNSSYQSVKASAILVYSTTEIMDQFAGSPVKSFPFLSSFICCHSTPPCQPLKQYVRNGFEARLHLRFLSFHVAVSHNFSWNLTCRNHLLTQLKQHTISLSNHMTNRLDLAYEVNLRHYSKVTKKCRVVKSTCSVDTLQPGYCGQCSWSGTL